MPQKRVIAVAVALAFGAPAFEVEAQSIAGTTLPTGGRVVGGQAAITQSGASMAIQQTTHRAALDWQSFNIGSQAAVRFSQPSASSIALNRVLGNDSSQIFGQLSANGQVFLLNPNGILFGRGAQVDVGGLLASTLSMSSDDFMSGRYLLRNPGSAGSIVNQGSIKAGTRGYAALVAPTLTNDGVIEAQSGTVALTAANAATVDLLADGLVQIRVDEGALRSEITNNGVIRADGGNVILTAKAVDNLARAVVNNAGIIEARTVENIGGVVRLGGRAVTHSGAISGAKDIALTGSEVLLVGGSTVTAASHGDVSIIASDRAALHGTLSAPSGRVHVQAGAVMSSGVTRVDAGAVRIVATQDLTLDAGSRISVNGANGGSIALASETGGILLAGALEANGTAGDGGSLAMEAPWVALGGTVTADGTETGGSIAVQTGWLSLADRVSARGGSGAGGTIRFDVAGKTMQNLSSLVDASGASGGSIRHVAGQQITTSGTYLANGAAGPGGRIDLSAPATKLLSAKVHADGATGGGQVRVGGELRGGKDLPTDELPNAELLAISRGSALSADATQTGPGGTVIAWANHEAAMFGDATARPASGAPGGFIEISSGDKLTYGGTANAGPGGTVLFDPKNIVIAAAGASQYSIVLGYNYVDVARLKGNDLEAGDGFGSAVSLSGTQLAVGASADDGAGNVATAAGAVYLFNNPFTTPALAGVIGKGYTGAGNLNVIALAAGDNFGYSVSLSGTQLAVGAISDDGAGNGTLDAGAVYLFNTPFTAPALAGVIGKGYTGAGNLDVSSLEAGDNFGVSVSLSGTRLAVGAFGDDGAGNAASGAGAVYLFNNPFSAPVLAGVIGKGYTGTGDFDVTALEADDFFGTSVSLSDTQLAVGALGDDGAGNSAPTTGAVYLINNPFSAPMLTGIIGKGYAGAGNLDVGALEAGDFFGSSVSLSGTQLAVGAVFDDGAGNTTSAAGAVYLFNNPFTAPALAGVIGKGYTGSGNMDVSALEVGDQFGTSVSLGGTQLAVGAIDDDGAGNSTTSAGAVYLFNNPFSAPALVGVMGKGYSRAGSFDVSALNASDTFGISVSLSGTQLAVGATGDAGADNATSVAGAVYLFNNPFSAPALAGVIGKGYTGTGNLDVTALEANDGFGSSLSLSGTQLAVGAAGDDGAGNSTSNAGAVYLFNNPFSAPTLAGVIGKGYTGTGNLDVSALAASDFFGSSVSLSGTQIAVGANGDAGATNTVTNAGAVYLFNSPFTAPGLAGVIGKGYTGAGNFDVAMLAAGDSFGASVSLSGTQLVVGATGDDGAGDIASGAGAVYLFNNPFSAPSLAGVIGKSYTGAGNFDVAALEAGDSFGVSVSLSGTQLAVGASFDNGANNLTSAAGAVYLINNPFNTPALVGVIGKGYTGTGNFDVTALESFDQFGNSVSLSGTQLAMGARGDDGASNSTSDAGAVYLFNNPFTAPALAGVIGKGYTGTGNLDVSALEAFDFFGSSVSFSGTQLAVGAPQDYGAGNGTTSAGAVYLFNNPFTAPALAGVIGKGYTGTGNLDVSALEAFDDFGVSVSLSGTQLAVGAYRDDGFNNSTSNAGAVYLFNNPFSAPTLAGVIGKGYTGPGNFNVSALEASDLFGSSVSLAGTQLAVGAFGDDGAGNVTSGAGAVYLINNPFSTPAVAGMIGKGYTGPGNFNVSALEASDFFGHEVSLSGAQLVVGAPGDDGAGNVTSGAGAVYLINNPFSAPALVGVIGKGYTGTGNLDVAALATNDSFGGSVSLSGTQLAVGASGDDGAGNVATDAGAVYLFNNPFSAPTLAGVIGKGYTDPGNFNVSALEASDSFGQSVSLSGTQLAVGAPGDDGAGNGMSGAGAVYGFTLGGGDPAAGATFAADAAQNYTIAPASITAITNTGSAVVLQANNDITVNEAVTTSAAGSGGAITMQAGRSILVNAGITTDNGSLTLIANERLANGVVDAHRDAGAAVIAMAPGTTINAGSGNISLTLNDGLGLTNRTSGDITLANLTTTGHVLVQNLGQTANSGIVRADAGSLVSALSAAFIATPAGGGGKIGTATAPMRTTASGLEALAQDGGAFFSSPSQGVTIGGAALGGLNGLDTSGTGAIEVIAEGTLAVTEDLGSSSGGVTLTANGALSNLTITGPGGGVNSIGGAVSLTAGQDIVHGSSAQQINTSSGAISLSAGRDILHNTGANQINSSSGSITLGAGRDIVHDSASQINTSSGPISLTAVRDIVSSGSAGQINSSSGSITVNAGQDFVRSGTSGQVNTSGGAIAITTGRDYVYSASSQTNTFTAPITLNVGRDYLHSSSNRINSSSGAVTVRAGNSIVFSNSGDISTSGASIILNADQDGNGAGAISLGAGTSIASGGGAITLGGGTDPLAAPAIGTASNIYGVKLDGASLLSGAGNISVRGQGSGGATPQTFGVYLRNGSVIESSSGTISVTGAGSGTNVQNHGVFLEDSGTTRITSTATGNIFVTGSVAAGSTNNSDGIALGGGFAGMAKIESLGSGAISLTGTGAPGSGAGDFGIRIASSGRVISSNGAIALSGTGGSGGSGDDGIVIDGTVQSTGSGSIALMGTGGNSAGGSNRGVLLFGTANITSVSGAVSISGTGGGSGAGNAGVELNTGAKVQSTGTATISLTGTGVTGAPGITTDGAGNLIGNSIQANTTGNITLTSLAGSGINLGDPVTTSGDVVVSASGSITQSAAAIMGTNVSLAAGGSIGTVSTTSTGTLSLTTTASGSAGNITVNESNALNTNRVVIATDAASQQTVSLTSTNPGGVTIGGNIDFSTTGNDSLTLNATAGDIVGGVGRLTSGGNATITLNANNIGSAANPVLTNAGTGTLVLNPGAAGGNVYISNNYVGGLHTYRGEFGPGGTRIDSSLASISDSHTFSLKQTAGNIFIAGDGFLLDQGNGTGQTGTLILDASAGSIVYRGDLPVPSGGPIVHARNVTLHASGDVGTSGSRVLVNAEKLTARSDNGSVFLEANPNRSYISTSPGIAMVQRVYPNVTLQDQAGFANGAPSGAYDVLASTGLLANAGAITAQSVTLTADKMALAAGTVSASSGTAILQPNSLSKGITVGPITDAAAGELELSISELATVTAGTLQVGRTDGTATLTLTQALGTTDVNAGTLRLVHGNVISDSGVNPGANIGSTATPFAHNLELKANNNVQFRGNNIVLADGKNLTITADLDNNGVGNAQLGTGQFTIQVGTTAANTGSMTVSGAGVNVAPTGLSGDTGLITVMGSGAQTFRATKGDIAFVNDNPNGSLTISTAGGAQTFDTMTGALAGTTGNMMAQSVGSSGTAGGISLFGASQTVNLTGALSLLGGAGSVALQNAAGTQTVNASGISVAGGAGTNSFAQIFNLSSTVGQSVTAGSGGLSLTGGSNSGGNSGAFLSSNFGTQSITVNGGNVSLLGGTNATGNNATIFSSGAQSINVNNAASMSLVGQAGVARISASGNQSIMLTGAASANALTIGSATSGTSAIINGANQVITAGATGQSGSITVRGGTSADQNSGFSGTAGSQAISTSGTMTLIGGTALGTGPTCGFGQAGSCAFVNNNGTGLLTVTANALTLQGGAGGVANNAVLGVTGGPLLLNVGSGGLTMLGGSGTSGNSAVIGGSGAANQTLTINVAGNTTLAGGSTFNSPSLIGLGGSGSTPVSIAVNFAGGGNLVLNAGTATDAIAAIGSTGRQTNATTNLNISAANVTLNDSAATVSRIGHSSTANGPGNIAITTPGNLALNGTSFGSAIRTTGNVTLQANTISESAASIIAANTLTTTSTNGTTLSGGGNAISVFNATNTIGGGVTLVNTASPLTITGIAKSGAGVLSITNTGPIAITGPVGAGSGAVTLTTTGTITESGSGAISTSGLLSTSSTGGTTLGGANTVSQFTASNAATGNISLANQVPLAITSISQTGGDIAVTNNGSLNVSGIVSTIGAGNITLSGDSAGGGAGAFIAPTANVAANGSGNVAITGISRGAGVFVGGRVASHSGNVAITGTGGPATGSTTVFGVGNPFGSTPIIQARGTVTLTGTGGTTGSGTAAGVGFSAASIEGGTGVVITGVGGTSTTGGAAGVILTNGTHVSAEGPVTISGTGGNAGGNNGGSAVGVILGGLSDAVGTITDVSAMGLITINGQGGTANPTDASLAVGATGVALNQALVESLGGVAITGTAGRVLSGNGSATAVSLRASTVQTASSGNISITGTGGTGANATGVGIADASTIQTVGIDIPELGGFVAGTGSITLTGTGGNATGTGGANGVSLSQFNTPSGATVTTNTGAISINGTAGTAVTGEARGVVLRAASSVESLAGGAIAVVGRGGTSNATGNSSVSGTIISAQSSVETSGGITLTGTGGTNLGAGGAAGVGLSDLAFVHALGSNGISITGVGGASAGGVAHGIAVMPFSSSGASVIADAGNIALTGTAGTSSASPSAIAVTDSIVSANAGAMTINATGMLSIVASGAAAQVSAGGMQTINANGISLKGAPSGSGLRAMLTSQGGQNITVGAGGISAIGGGGTNNNVEIFQGGADKDQVITVNGAGDVVLTGGTGTSSNADIINMGRAQTITFASGGSLTLQGGSGAGGGNDASIENAGSGATTQTIAFPSGGAINVTGGTVGVDNWAEISTNFGGQTISGTADITLVGGASGGGVDVGNTASISVGHNDAGAVQTIGARNVVLTGGAGGTQNMASISTQLTGQRTNITATGSVILTGGAGADAGAVIGTDQGEGSITVNATGPITLTAGSGAAADLGPIAAIGTARGFNANTTLVSGGTIGLNGALAKVGATQGGGGTLSLTGSNVALGSGFVGTTGNVALSATSGQITQGGGGVSAGTLTTASAAGTALGGANTVSTFNATNTASGNLLLTNTAPTLTIAGITQSAIGSVNISNTGALVVGGAINANGDVSLSATGALSNAAAAAINAAGNASFNGSSLALGSQAGDAMNFGSLTFNSSGAVNIDEDSAMTLTGTSTAGTLALRSTGSIANSATVTATGSASLTAGDQIVGAAGGVLIAPDVTLASLNGVTAFNTRTSALTITNTNNDVDVRNVGVLNLNAVNNINGALTLDNVGNVTVSRPARVGRQFKIAAHSDINVQADIVANTTGTSTTSIDLTADTNVNQSAGTTLNAGGSAVSLGAGGTIAMSGAVSASDLTATTTGGSVMLPTSNLSGGLSVTTSGGSISESGSLTVAGTTTLQAGSGTISLSSASNDFGGTVTATGTGGIILTDANTLTLATVDAGTSSATLSATSLRGAGPVIASTAMLSSDTPVAGLTTSVTNTITVTGTATSWNLISTVPTTTITTTSTTNIISNGACITGCAPVQPTTIATVTGGFDPTTTIAGTTSTSTSTTSTSSTSTSTSLSSPTLSFSTSLQSGAASSPIQILSAPATTTAPATSMSMSTAIAPASSPATTTTTTPAASTSTVAPSDTTTTASTSTTATTSTTGPAATSPASADTSSSTTSASSSPATSTSSAPSDTSSGTSTTASSSPTSSSSSSASSDTSSSSSSSSPSQTQGEGQTQTASSSRSSQSSEQGQEGGSQSQPSGGQRGTGTGGRQQTAATQRSGGAQAGRALPPATAQLVAAMSELHAQKVQALEKGVQILERNPAAADLKPCAGQASGDCIAQRPARIARPSVNVRTPTVVHVPQIERKVALLIGVNDYRGAIPKLNSPLKDIQEIGKIYRDQFGYEVRTLPNADKATIVRALNRLILESGPNDSVTVFYAGHGQVIEKTGRGYWIPARASADDPRQWISNQDIGKALENIPAKQVLLVSDSCYSGTLTRDAKLQRADVLADPQAVLQRRSVTVLSSGGEEPVADAGKDGHSVFAWHFMQALRGVDRWSNGVDVYERLAGSVTQDFPQEPQYGEAIGSGHQRGGDFLFEVRRY